MSSSGAQSSSPQAPRASAMPRSGRPSARVTLSTRFLVLGMVASVLLAIPTAVLPLAMLTRVQRTALELADDSQQTTYYLGEVGEQLARLRVRALQPGSPEEVARIEERLQTAVEALPEALDPPTRQRWASLEGELGRLGRVYEDARAESLAGRRARAAELLAREAAATAGAHDALSEVAAPRASASGWPPCGASSRRAAAGSRSSPRWAAAPASASGSRSLPRRPSAGTPPSSSCRGTAPSTPPTARSRRPSACRADR